MREIKFRGLSEKGEMVYGFLTKDLPNSTLYYNEYSYRIHWETECGKGTVNCPVKNGTVGQFTGMQDKNGVEIYEGDLVRAYKPNTYLGPGDLLEVRWNEDRGCWAYWNNRINRWATGSGGVPMTVGENRNGRWCEVIGNIYANPNLLSDKR